VRDFSGTRQGPVTVTEDAIIDGVVIGDVFVTKDTHLELRGVVIGDLIIEEGSAAVVHGTVQGAMINRGGKVEIYGAVQSVRGTGNTRIAFGAVISK
jgi:cytoskeletal protein CcmA (bactofilin family)